MVGLVDVMEEFGTQYALMMVSMLDGPAIVAVVHCPSASGFLEIS